MRDLKGYINLLLKYRLRTKRELIQKMKRKGFSEEEIKKEIESLEREGIIDDERFARIFVREEIEKRALPQFILLKKLIEKGVDYEIAKKVLEEEYDEGKIFETANRIINKLKRAGKNEEKIYEYFIRRGFPPEFIKKFLKGLNSQEN